MGLLGGMKMSQDEIRKHIELQRVKLAQKVEKQKLEEKIKLKQEKERKQKELLDQKLAEERAQAELDVQLQLKKLSTIEEESSKPPSEAAQSINNDEMPDVERDEPVAQYDNSLPNPSQIEDPTSTQIHGGYQSTFGNGDTFNDRADSYFGATNNDKPMDKSPRYSDDEDFDDYFERDEPDQESYSNITQKPSEHIAQPVMQQQEKPLEVEDYDTLQHEQQAEHPISNVDGGQDVQYQENPDFGRTEKTKVKFEIMSQVESLKRKIQEQQKVKRVKNEDAKKAALAQIFKNKTKIDDGLKQANQVHDNLSNRQFETLADPKDEPRSEESHEFGNIHNIQNETPGFLKASVGMPIPPEHVVDDPQDAPQHDMYNNDLLKSQKFDQHMIRNLDLGDHTTPNSQFQRSAKNELGYNPDFDDEIEDDVYEEDFEQDAPPDHKVSTFEAPDNDDLDRNMEIPIAVNPNNRYQTTFGMSQDSLADVSNMNPLEESEYTKVAPQKMDFYATADQNNITQNDESGSEKRDTGSFFATKDKDFVDQRPEDNVFEYNQQTLTPTQTDGSRQAQKEVQMSFKFQNEASLSIIDCTFFRL